MATNAMKRPRTKEESSNETKKVILDAVRKLVEERNGVEFSLADIARYSGKNSALVSYHFGGKEQMIMAALEEDVCVFAAMVDRLHRSAGLNAEQKLRSHIRETIRLHGQRPYLSVLYQVQMRQSDAESAKRIADLLIAPISRLYSEALEQGEREGAFRKVDVFTLFTMVAGAIDIFFASKPTVKYGFRRNSASKKLQREFSGNLSDMVIAAIRKP